MGLYIGASFLAFFQLLDYICTSIYNRWADGRHKSPRNVRLSAHSLRFGLKQGAIPLSPLTTFTTVDENKVNECKTYEF